MAQNKDKLIKAVNELEEAMKLSERALQEHILYAGIAKCFEVCLEYSWKYLKRLLDEKGLDIYGPKDVIREAGRAGLIEDVDHWIKAINIRNYAVHDYLGVTPEEYLDTIAAFLPHFRKLCVPMHVG